VAAAKASILPVVKTGASSSLASLNCPRLSMTAALPISAVPLPAGFASKSCQAVQAGTAETAEQIPLPARAFTVRPQNGVFLAVGRYGDGVTTGAAAIEAGVETLVNVPQDSSDEPWRIGFLGGGAKSGSARQSRKSDRGTVRPFRWYRITSAPEVVASTEVVLEPDV
jgi:hypothetical protein